MMEPDYKKDMEFMIETLRRFGISDERVIKAMQSIPRHHFVEDNQKAFAYGDHPLPIPERQSISQPYTVAFMLEALDIKNGMRVLEIGTGSGWNLGLLWWLVGKNGKAVGIEYREKLVEYAKENLSSLMIDAEVVLGDGSLGYDKYALYDRIVISAGCPEIPQPVIEQLREGGIMLAPVGRLTQTLIKGVKKDGKLITENLGLFRFVPLLGEHGFHM